MTTIMTIEEQKPRGTVIDRRVGGPPFDEADNFFKCEKCGGWFDARDLRWVEAHQGALLHPTCDRVQ